MKKRWLLAFCILLIGSIVLLGHAAAAETLSVKLDTGETVTLTDADNDGYYEIGTDKDLFAFQIAVNSGKTDLCAVLTADITQTITSEWITMGSQSLPYTGTLDGAGHTIRNLQCYQDEEVALVGYLSGGTIKNLTIADSAFRTEDFTCLTAAAFVVHNDGGTIRNCHNHADVNIIPCSILENVAGIVVYNNGFVIDCTNTASNSGQAGVVNENRGYVINCHNTADIGDDVQRGAVGGIAAGNYGVLFRCTNSGTIKEADFVGGIAAYNNSLILDCHNEGTVISEDGAGGIAAVNEGTIESCSNSVEIPGLFVKGGIAAHIDAGKIVNCYDSVGQRCFGISYADIINCFATGYEPFSLSTPASSAEMTNYFFLHNEQADNGGRTAEQFASGEIAWIMNAYNGEEVWKQTLGIDAFPSFSGKTVYRYVDKQGNVTYTNGAEGTCGAGLTWILGDNGVLTISGTGAMAEWEEAPWAAYAQQIRRVEIGAGVTSVSASAFAGCQIRSILLPEGVTVIGEAAFQGCNKLIAACLPQSVAAIGEAAFSDCEKLEHVTYAGTQTQWQGVFLGADNEPLSDAEFFHTQTRLESSMNSVHGELCCPVCREDVVLRTSVENDHPLVTVLGRTPTCTQTGLTNGKRCVVCDCMIVEQEIIPILEHSYDAGTVTPPTSYEQGYTTYRCVDCGHSYQTDFTEMLPMEPEIPLSIRSWSLSLENDLTVNFTVDAKVMQQYQSVYMEFQLVDGIREYPKVVVEPVIQSDGRAIFSFEHVAPYNIKDSIRVRLVGTYSDWEYVLSDSCRVLTYCRNMLSHNIAPLNTLIVDLLNFGTAQQLYANHNTHDLIHAELSDAQKAWGSTGVPAVTNRLNPRYAVVSGATASFKSATLVVDNSVSIRYKVQLPEDTEGIVAIVTMDGGRQHVIPFEQFEPQTDYYYIYMDELLAVDMREDVYITIYRGSTPISHTVRYSVASYMATAYGTGSATLDALLVAMLHYGDSAKNFFS